MEAKELTYRYGMGTPLGQVAADNVNTSIRRGKFPGVIGHADSGKSTLTRRFNSLTHPTSGQALLNGNDIWAEPKRIRAMRFQIGLVFQYPEHQLFEETVLHDICFDPRNMELSEEGIKERALGAAEFVGLKTELLEKSPLELSGGEKCRAAIVGMIAMGPEALILDEPVVGLNLQGRDQLFGQIRSYHQQRGDTVLLVSHSMEDIARVADRALVMNRGKAAILDTVQQVSSRRSKLENMGLRVLQITKIMSLLRAKGYPINESALIVGEALRDLLPLLWEGGCVR